MSELKSCPFCGGEAYIERMGTNRVSMQIECGDCGAGMETGETWINEHSQWNKRPVEDQLRADLAESQSEIERLRESLNVAVFAIDYAIEHFGYLTPKTGKLCSYSKQELEVRHLIDQKKLLRDG